MVDEPEVELPGLLLLGDDGSSSSVSVWLPLLGVPGDVLEPLLLLLPEPEDG